MRERERRRENRNGGRKRERDEVMPHAFYTDCAIQSA